jgi:hypothetical protein
MSSSRLGRPGCAGQTPSLYSRLAIWNQERIKVRILRKDELSKEKVREGPEEVSYLSHPEISNFRM